MKKLIFLFTSILILNACSSDDSASASINSSLKIGGENFIPSNINTSVGVPSGNFSIRSFGMTKGNLSLGFAIGIPDNASETGSYSLGITNLGEAYASGGYTTGTKHYSIIGDDIQIEAMGDGIYKVTFINTQLQNINDQSDTKTLTGSIEGNFGN